MRYLSLLSILLLFYSFGCAHKAATIHPISSQSSSPSRDGELVNPGTNQVRPVEGKVISINSDTQNNEHDYFDEDIEQEDVSVADPLSPWNHLMFQFNDKLYFWALKPVAKGYKAIAPRQVREGVQSFFNNISTPIRFVNCIFQGKGNAAVNEFSRFLFNSTYGILGFNDFSGRHGLKAPNSEDFGQTFGVYGIGNGMYIVWPFLGPSTIRDSLGIAGDSFLNPITYIPPPIASVGIHSYEKVNKTSFYIGDYETLKEASFDPYVAIREAYIQNRKSEVEK
ncbi:MAG: VacJ family lipoprotein [bacterium]